MMLLLVLFLLVRCRVLRFLMWKWWWLMNFMILFLCKDVSWWLIVLSVRLRKFVIFLCVRGSWYFWIDWVGIVLWCIIILRKVVIFFCVVLWFRRIIYLCVVVSLFSVIFIMCCEICGICLMRFLNGWCWKWYSVIFVMVVILKFMVFWFGCLIKFDGKRRLIICVCLFFNVWDRDVILEIIEVKCVKLFLC